jgi:hypothetical protein
MHLSKAKESPQQISDRKRSGMGDELRDPVGIDAGDQLRASLKELGDMYEPDLPAIYQRLSDTRRLVHDPAQTRPRRILAMAPGARPVLLPVAIILLLVGIVRTTFPEASDSGITQSAGIPITGQASGHAARVTVETLRPTATRSVHLGGPELLDWLALGTRSDLQQVRARAGSSAPAITVEQPATATSAPSPFRISWTGGLPDPVRTQASTWLMFKGPQQVSITVAPANRSRTVVLYAGTKDVRTALSIAGPGITTTSTPIGAASTEAQNLIVTVAVPPTTGPTQLRLLGTSIRPTSRIQLAAATLT